jgi:hypothetical protein
MRKEQMRAAAEFDRRHLVVQVIHQMGNNAWERKKPAGPKCWFQTPQEKKCMERIKKCNYPEFLPVCAPEDNA